MIIFLLTTYLIEMCCGNQNNACPSYDDYYTINRNPKCYYNPDVLADFDGVLRNHFETYTRYGIITDDNFIVSLYKIPQKNPKGAIIMQHGLLSDASSYVIQGNTSYAYFFHQQGFEIWLTSTRGTTLSPGHVSLNQQDPEYWNWSFHECAIYDTRSVINFVKQQSNNSKIVFIGHSQGGINALIYSSLYPEEAHYNVNLFLLLVPGGYFAGKRATVLGPHLNEILLNLVQALGAHGVTENSIISRVLKSFYCNLVNKRVGAFIVNLFVGLRSNIQDDPNLYYVAPNAFFKGTSIKNAKHWNQLIKSNQSQMYDYGTALNLKIYGTVEPPPYPYENIRVPIYIFGGEKDTLITPEALKRLHRMLPEETKIYGGPTFIKNFNHIDFLIGRYRVNFYVRILDIINKLL